MWSGIGWNRVRAHLRTVDNHLLVRSFRSPFLTCHEPCPILCASPRYMSSSALRPCFCRSVRSPSYWHLPVRPPLANRCRVAFGRHHHGPFQALSFPTCFPSACSSAHLHTHVLLTACVCVFRFRSSFHRFLTDDQLTTIPSEIGLLTMLEDLWVLAPQPRARC